MPECQEAAEVQKRKEDRTELLLMHILPIASVLVQNYNYTK